MGSLMTTVFLLDPINKPRDRMVLHEESRSGYTLVVTGWGGTIYATVQSKDGFPMDTTISWFKDDPIEDILVVERMIAWGRQSLEQFAYQVEHP
jgi:hypothetical protein